MEDIGEEALLRDILSIGHEYEGEDESGSRGLANCDAVGEQGGKERMQECIGHLFTKTRCGKTAEGGRAQ